MCGIAGIVNLSNDARPVHEGELRAMNRQLRHRGPDEDGVYLDAPVGLAHSRLSIIDLATGQQPMSSADGQLVLVFNGEIFNFIELREQLEQRGCSFRTNSDTEVILQLYREKGEDMVHDLNGQFAFALWDRRKQSLLLARDRAGICPLFYARDAGRLYFSSEIKAIVPLLSSSPQLSLTALDQLFTFWSPVSPNTVFEGINEVRPGELIILREGCLEFRRYWDWTYPEHPDQYLVGTEEELAGRLQDLLVDATRLRLRSDVPVAAYLSGGLDSSILATLMQQQVRAPLHTFSIGFQDSTLDEGDWQQLMVQHLQSRHQQLDCRYEDLAPRLMDSLWHTETPVLRLASLPMGMLSGLVRAKGFKVVLTGEGADEVFGGYDIFKEAKVRQFWARRPGSRTRPLLLKRLYPYLDLPKNGEAAYLKAFFGAGIKDRELPHFSHLPRWNSTARAKQFFSSATRAALSDASAVDAQVVGLPTSLARMHPFNRSQYLEATTLMPGYLLSSQGDRMLAMHSVEGRYPFLDHRVIEFANRLHPNLKMKVLNEKYLLKRAMGGRLPPQILRRHKQPYRAPDARALESRHLSSTLTGLLGEDALGVTGFFDPGKVAMLVRKNDSGRDLSTSESQALTGILSTQAIDQLFRQHYQQEKVRL